MTTRTILSLLCGLALLTVGTLPAPAQTFDEIMRGGPGTGDGPTSGETGEPGMTLIDGIAAIVGDKIILISEVYQQTALIRQRSEQLRRIPERTLLKEVLNDLVASKLLLVRAEEDSVSVSEDAINGQMEEYIDRLVREAGSTAMLEQQYSRTMAEIRADIRKLVRDQLLVQVLQRQKFADMKMTDRDIQDFFAIYKDSLAQVPEQIEIAHIYRKEEPTAEGRAATEALARAIADSIRNGGDFADFARRYSTDPGSAAKGGEYGWIATGRFVKEYDEAAESLGINEISGPVESKYGIHVIQLLDKREGEHRTRHILLPLRATPSERQAILDTLESLRRRAMAGENFAALAEQYSQDDASRYRGGLLATYPTEGLGKYAWILDSLDIGEVSAPREIPLSPTETGYHIIQLVRVIPPHAADPVEDRALLEEYAADWKQQKMLADWVAQLKEEIYWEIKYGF